MHKLLIFLMYVFLIGCGDEYSPLIDKAYKANHTHNDKLAYETIMKVPDKIIVERGMIPFKLAVIGSYRRHGYDEQLKFLDKIQKENYGDLDMILFQRSSIYAIQSTKFKDDKYIIIDQKKFNEAKELLIKVLKNYSTTKDRKKAGIFATLPEEEFPLLDHLLK